MVLDYEARVESYISSGGGGVIIFGVVQERGGFMMDADVQASARNWGELVGEEGWALYCLVN